MRAECAVRAGAPFAAAVVAAMGALAAALPHPAEAQVAIRGEVVHPVSGPSIENSTSTSRAWGMSRSRSSTLSASS